MFEVKIDRLLLVKSLSRAQSIVERKTTMQILSHLKLQAKDNILTITAIDSSITFVEIINAEVIYPGTITLPAHVLHDLVRKFSFDEVHIQVTSESVAEIMSGHSVFKLPFLSGDDFPTIEDSNYDCEFDFPRLKLLKIIEKNKHTIAQEDARYNLNGIHLHVDAINQQIRATSTDGHRLTSVKINMIEGAEKMPPVTIPRKTIFELYKILIDKQSDIKISITKNKIKFFLQDIQLISKLIDGVFPEYMSLIPYDNQNTMQISSTELARALDRISTIMFEKSQATKFSVKNETRLEIFAAGDLQSSGKEELEIEANFKDFEIAFNLRYVMDIMSTVNGNDIKFKFNSGLSSTLLHEVDDEETDFVLMPMRV